MLELENSKQPNRVLGLFSIVMINVVAVVSLRSLPLIAGYGEHILFFYGLAILGFFLPTVLISAELSSAWPERGGLYIWVREAFNRKTAFFVIWLQWLYNLVWFPTILAFLAAVAARLFSPELATDKWYLLAFCLLVFWGVSALHLGGMRISTWLSNFGAVIGTLLPITALIIFALLWLWQGGESHVSVFTWDAVPTAAESYVIFPVVLFTLIGIEMSAVHAQEVKDPEKNYPRAMALSMILICGSLILGALALAVVLEPQNINMLSGLLDGLEVLLERFGLGAFVGIVAILVLSNGLCSVSAWMLGPCKSLATAAQDGDCPAIFKRQTEHGVPLAILAIQAVVFTGLCTLFVGFESIQEAYWLLSVMTSQLALVLYLLLFLSGLVLRRKYPTRKRQFSVPGGTWGMVVLASIGVMTCMLAIGLGFIPPASVPTKDLFWYESILTGCMFLAVLPPILWACYQR